jgi:hypothetical protein
LHKIEVGGTTLDITRFEVVFPTVLKVFTVLGLIFFKYSEFTLNPCACTEYASLQFIYYYYAPPISFERSESKLFPLPTMPGCLFLPPVVQSDISLIFYLFFSMKFTLYVVWVVFLIPAVGTIALSKVLEVVGFIPVD